MIIDDDQMNRDFYEELLKDSGYQVDIASNGQEGLDKLQSDTHYDLILLDIVMPIKDGIQMLKEFQASPHRSKHGKVYMLTSLGQESVAGNAKDLGADGFIAKADTSPEELLEKVKSIVG